MRIACHSIRTLAPVGAALACLAFTTTAAATEISAQPLGRFSTPTDVTAGPGGSLLIAERGADAVRQRLADGRIVTLADASTPSDVPGETGLSSPSAVAMDTSGRVLIADTGHDVIETLENGRLHVLAGTGPGFGPLGDGGPANHADLAAPSDVVAMPGGGFLIVDQGHQRVRAVAPDGTITTIAGTGTRSFEGDGGPAARAGLNLPISAAVSPDGAVLIADSGNNRIRAIADGTMHTIAGAGPAGSSGDGGPAVEAMLDRPGGVAPYQGGFLIADSGNRLVRVVDASGAISNWSSTFVNPLSVATIGDGLAAVADPAAGTVQLIGPAAGAVVPPTTGPTAPFTVRFAPRLRRLRHTLPITVSSDARVVVSARAAGARHWVTLASIKAHVGRNAIKLTHRSRQRLGRRGLVVLRARAVRADGRTVHSRLKVRLG